MRARQIGLLIGDGMEDLILSFSSERCPPCQQKMKKNTQRPHIAHVIVVFSDNFRSEVGWSSDHFVGRRSFGGVLKCTAEIDDLDYFCFGVVDHVFKFDISG